MNVGMATNVNALEADFRVHVVDLPGMDTARIATLKILKRLLNNWLSTL